MRWMRITLPMTREENNNGNKEQDRPDNDNSSSLWFGSDTSLPLTTAQQSLQRYVERVKAELGEDFSTTEGVYCKGEPSVDPSRQVQSQGDSEWMDDW